MGGAVSGIGGVPVGAGAATPSMETVKFETPLNRTPTMVIPEPNIRDIRA
jgi:hypothetical protein